MTNNYKQYTLQDYYWKNYTSGAYTHSKTLTFGKTNHIRKEIRIMELTDQEIQSLIDARKVCKDLQELYIMSRLDDILEEIYPGWISHLKEGY